jgi:hypothetical protein
MRNTNSSYRFPPDSGLGIAPAASSTAFAAIIPGTAMFGNFIYFIVVLLIYTTYPPAESPRFGPVETAILFALLFLAYGSFCRLQFRRLEGRIHREGFSRLDLDFHRIQTRMSVAAILLFGFDLYGLHLVEYTTGIPILDAVPTFRALLFLGVFLLYLAILWGVSHRVYARLYGSAISRTSYVLSNAALSVPVLLPWLVLSGVADLVGLLPFDAPKRFLGHPRRAGPLFPLLPRPGRPAGTASDPAILALPSSGTRLPSVPDRAALSSGRAGLRRHSVLAHLRRADDYRRGHGAGPEISLYPGHGGPAGSART